MSRFLPLALVSLLALGAPVAAAEQQCGLKQLGAFDVGDGRPEIMGTVQGSPLRFSVQFGSPYSGISEGLADALKLIKSPADNVGIYFGDTLVTHVALANLEFGVLRANQFPVFIIPRSIDDGTGILGNDILRRVDVELDLAHGKMNFFSQDHCPGRVVYWSRAAAVVPMRWENELVYSFKMQLDGTEVEATLVPGNATSTLPLSMARKLFNIEANSPGMSAVAHDSDGKVSVFRYRFKTLSSHALTITNPTIDIINDSDRQCRRNPYIEFFESSCNPTNLSFLRLGRNVLRMLRVYIAFGEKTAYLTAANA